MHTLFTVSNVIGNILLFVCWFFINLIVFRMFITRAKAQHLNPYDCKMVLPVIYCDGFEQSRSRNASVEGIYMSFANASMEEQMSAESRILLCEVPTGCDLMEAFNIVVVEQMRLLERGIDIYFEDLGKSVRCYGSIFCILGDHPSQAKLAGKLLNFILFICYYFLFQ